MRSEEEKAMVRSLIVLCVFAALAGCAPTTLAPLEPTHPASVDAAEAPVRAPSETLARPGAPVTAWHVADVYTCPMHPEVRQRTPGQCPVCGMALVPADGHAH
jgi:hypothetical protein